MIPAERYNAIAAAVQVGRDHVPFSVRRKAVKAAEAVVVDWEANHVKWCALIDEMCALIDEIDRLRADNDALKSVIPSSTST